MRGTTQRDNSHLGTEPINKLLRKFAIPSIIALLISSLYNIVDQFFIGHSVGMLGNAATNVAFPLVTICTSISLLCGIGAAANFNLAMGRKNEEHARIVAGNVIALIIICGVTLTVITRIFLKPLLILFGGTTDVLHYAEIYTSITSFGFPFLIFTVAGSNMVRADGAPVYSMLCTMVGAILNIILDPIFIFGFDMGMAGAAWATVIGQVVSAIMVAIHFLRFRTVNIRLQDIRPRLRIFADIAKLGVGSFFNQIAILFVQVTFNNLIVYHGARSIYGTDIPLAATGIILKINMIVFSTIIGIAQGLQPIFSFNYGAENYDRVRQALKTGATLAFVIGLSATVIFQLFPRQLIGLFGTGSDLYYEYAVRLFKIFLMLTSLNGFLPIFMNFFSSIGRAHKAVFLSLSRQLIFFIPLALLFTRIFGLEGLIYTAPVADFISFVVGTILITTELRKIRQLEETKLAREATGADHQSQRLS
ncbi:MAG TPA: MATE family efflux transporter [Clostridiaceae bacterium]|nr:MATE family efflux transporter [Clostridiaceae bacterium]